MHMRVLRGLSGKALPCGCLVGTYEMYDGRVTTMIDARGGRCSEPGHAVGATVIDVAPTPDEGAPLSISGSGARHQRAIAPEME